MADVLRLSARQTTSSRRRFIQGASGGLAAGLIAGMPGAAAGAAEAEEPSLVRSDGTYDTVPLRSDDVVMTVVQSRVRAVDGKVVRACALVVERKAACSRR